MASYLNIYLQKKKKEGEEKEERLLLCCISRANDIYSWFYDNNIGRRTDIVENGVTLHEFTASDIDDVIKEIDNMIAKSLIAISHTKEALPLVTNKDAIEDLLENLQIDKDYLRDLMHQKASLESLWFIFSDVNEDYSDFEKLYWSVD